MSRNRFCLVMISSVSTACGEGTFESTLTAFAPEVSAVAEQQGATHPLDPLTRREIIRLGGIIADSRSLPEISFFASIVPLEPPKSEVLAYRGGAFTRRALLYGYNVPANTTYLVTVNITRGVVEGIEQFPGRQAPLAASEYIDADVLAREDPEWQAKVAERGLRPADVYLDVWASGEVPPADDPAGVHRGHRIVRLLSFFRGVCAKPDRADPLNCSQFAPNPYGRPLENLVVAVCMTDRTVIGVESDSDVVPPIPTESGNAATVRPALGPLATHGANFKLDGHGLTWDKWSLRVGFNQREGLTLHDVRYDGRSILYRGSLSEVYVPYARDTLNWAWRSAFDMGEYHLGQTANTLEHNVDVPTNAVLLDVDLSDETLTPFRLPSVIGIYESFSGLGWSRVDPTTFVKDARGLRKLALTWNVWIGNYIYGVVWELSQDGTIAVTVQLTGTLLGQGVSSPEEAEQYGSLVAPNVGAPSHQHFFNFRLDMDVDGSGNHVEEVETLSAPATFRAGFIKQIAHIASEGPRDLNLDRNRGWAIHSTTRQNRLGRATGYSVRPTGWVRPFSADDFAGLQRALFAKHVVWFTKMRANELFASGYFPYQGEPGDGLPRYANGESIEGGDLVMWYTLGTAHHPEPEEYPVMPVETLGFKLKPDGFFDRNPILDLPR